MTTRGGRPAPPRDALLRAAAGRVLGGALHRLPPGHPGRRPAGELHRRGEPALRPDLQPGDQRRPRRGAGAAWPSSRPRRACLGSPSAPGGSGGWSPRSCSVTSGRPCWSSPGSRPGSSRTRSAPAWPPLPTSGSATGCWRCWVRCWPTGALARPWQGTAVALVLGAAALGHTFTDVGHLVALLLGLAAGRASAHGRRVRSPADLRLIRGGSRSEGRSTVRRTG